DTALRHLSALKENGQGDAETDYLIGRCYAAKKEFDKAQTHYDSAITKEPGRIDAYVQLAGLLAGPMNKPKEAANKLEEMVKKNPKSAEAFVARARFRQGANPEPNLAEAEKDLAVARQLAPEDADVLLVSGGQRLAEAIDAQDDGARARSLQQAREFLD